MSKKSPLHKDLENEYSLLKDCLILKKQTEAIAKSVIKDDQPFDEEEIEELEIFYGLTKAAVLWERQRKGMVISPLQQAMYRHLWDMLNLVHEVLVPLRDIMDVLFEIDRKLMQGREKDEASDSASIIEIPSDTPEL